MGLNAEICEVWRRGGCLDGLLTQFVAETASRAAGCWKLEEKHLVLIGFGSAIDMSDEVSAGFQSATRKIGLDQTGLGIVIAAVTAQPAIGRRDPQKTGLEGSAAWIARFEANTSLAVPIYRAQTNEIAGVIAVSTADFVKEGDALWNRMVTLAAELSANTRAEACPSLNK